MILVDSLILVPGINKPTGIRDVSGSHDAILSYGRLPPHLTALPS